MTPHMIRHAEDVELEFCKPPPSDPVGDMAQFAIFQCALIVHHTYPGGC